MGIITRTLLIAALLLSALCLQAFSLEPSSPFELKVTRSHPNDFILDFQIAPQYALYKKSIRLTTLEGSALPNQAIVFPPAQMRTVDGESQEIYEQDFALRVTSSSGFLIQYQGCSDKGLCLMPVKQEILPLPEGNVQIKTQSPNWQPSENPITPHPSSYKTLFTFFILGLLLACSPCIFPMVPIMASLIVSNHHPHRKDFSFILCYVLTVAICYAIVGSIASLSGLYLESFLQTPIFLITLSGLLFLLALNQFEWISIRYPAIFSHTIHQIEHQPRSYSRAIGMGILSAGMLSPCVTPALIGALAYLGQNPNPTLGTLSMFIMALGMGTPLLMVGLLGKRYLPSAGPWMKWAKNITGVLLILLSASLLFRILPDRTDLTIIQSESDFSHAQAKARAEDRPLIVEVYAKWCTNCRTLDKKLFQNPSQTLLSKALVVKLDLTTPSPHLKALQKRLNHPQPPSILFLTAHGEELRDLRLTGQIDLNTFHQHLKQLTDKKDSKPAH